MSANARPRHVRLLLILLAALTCVSLLSVFWALKSKMTTYEVLRDMNELRRTGEEEASDLRSELVDIRVRARSLETTIQELRRKSERANMQHEKMRAKCSGKAGDAKAGVSVTRTFVDDFVQSARSAVNPDCMAYGTAGLDPGVVHALVVPQQLPIWAELARPRRAAAAESSEARRDSFDRIAAERSWSRESVSGEGSVHGENTERVALLLDRMVPKMRAELRPAERLRVVDVACGDFSWMSDVVRRHADALKYTGVDIVQSLVEAHAESHAQTNIRFEQRDVVVDGLPDAPYDLIFARHLFQHLVSSDIQTVLELFRAHARRYADEAPRVFLLASTYPDWPAHVDLDTESLARFRKVNLQREPFSLPPPLCWSHDYSYSFLALWELTAMPQADEFEASDV
ncbi:hypothetical protein DIPPA_09471 [Diplonema papillatum]|nr:hypothetical protein DIPPA_09471 [Diplonema papillatum]